MNKLNVLINAYACRPNAGSEPGMGWNWILNLSQYCNLHIITEGEWRDEIEKTVSELPQNENLHFYYLPVTEKIRKMCWNQGNWLFYIYYREWQKRAYQQALQIISVEKIDVVHQLNMIGYREPGYLWKIGKIPFVWGPVGGMENMPVKYIRGEDFSKKIFVLVKNILNNLQIKYQYRVKKALRRADVIIASGRGIEKKIDRNFYKKSITINETGCYIHESNRRKNTHKKTFDIIWVGKFDYRKQLGLALSTIHELKHLPGLKFHIVGTGNEKHVRYYQKMSNKLGLDNICIWYGSLENHKVQEMMRVSDLFFLTSIMEATSTVVVEAISNQLPVLCFNTCGFGPIIDDNIGRKIELSNPRKSVREFKDRIEYLYHHREILSRMSQNCSLKSHGDLSWDIKTRNMVNLYEYVIQNKIQMKKYFGVPIEFDRDVLEKFIEEKSVTTKGYCCFVDSFVLVSAHRKDTGLMNILENSSVNACDGRYIALFASSLYKQKFIAYSGPDFFSKYVYSPDKQCIIGNTEDVFKKIRQRIESEGHSTDNLMYISLPYSDVENYNYETIARQINAFEPRYIWVSLGAPKQEFFMYNLLPQINKGMMLGIGAALNFFSGEIKEIPIWAIKTNLIWFYRIMTEPRKQSRRSFFILKHYFEIYLAEKRKINKL